MKKSWIIGTVLLLAGVLLFSIGYFGSGRDLSLLDGTAGPIRVALGPDGDWSVGIFPDGSAEEVRRVFAAEGVTEIALSELYGDVEVRPSADGQIWLIVGETENYGFAAEYANGRLSLRREANGREKHWSFGTEEDLPDTVLLLPEMEGCTIRLENAFGEISLEDLRMDCSVLASAEAGEVSAENCAVRELTLRTSMGKVDAENVKVDTAAVLETKMGEVSVENLSAGERIRLSSDMGSVNGTLAGSRADYTIRASASMGVSNLPETEGHGGTELEVTTRMGEIDIRFAEKETFSGSVKEGTF